MIKKMASLLFLQPLTATLLFLRNPHHIPTSKSLKPKPLTLKPLLTTPLFSLAESDSPKSLQPETRTALQDLADSFDLPPDYFAKLPNDLRLDLNDAAFDLSNGKIIDEVTKVMARMASGDTMCLGTESVRENFTGIIRLQDIRATEIVKVDMHRSFHPGDIVRAIVRSVVEVTGHKAHGVIPETGSIVIARVPK